LEYRWQIIQGKKPRKIEWICVNAWKKVSETVFWFHTW
jgi:hypothetical protein